jgi:hypothetical protein
VALPFSFYRSIFFTFGPIVAYAALRLLDYVMIASACGRNRKISHRDEKRFLQALVAALGGADRILLKRLWPSSAMSSGSSAGSPNETWTFGLVISDHLCDYSRLSGSGAKALGWTSQ